jgi:cytochrome c oxidase subunit 1
MATTTLPRAATGYRSGLYEWVTTTDHKRIGILYIVNSFIFFFLGGLLALGIRTELARPGLQVVTDAALYNQLFTMHGSVMIFLFIIPILAGFGNYVAPLQIGAPDMAFPRINALSFWMLPLGGILLFLGFVTGGAAQAGWTSYTPLSEDMPLAVTRGRPGPLADGPDPDRHELDPGLGELPRDDLQDAGAGHDALPDADPRLDDHGHEHPGADGDTGLHERPDHALHRPQPRRPLLQPENGGNAILWQNVFWFYSHPAVYVMVLPAMGIISEVLPVFSRKPLFGYKAFVFATAAIGALGFSVWAHHMFTTGAVFLPFFSLMTFFIAVPTGVKMFNWIFTMWRGKLSFSTPLLFAIGFLTMFLIGGINGAFSPPSRSTSPSTTRTGSSPTSTYVLFGGSVFGVFAGVYYWFPKMTGRMLSEALGKVQFVMMFIGFNLTFFPMHQLGLAGMPRRIADYAEPGWNDLNLAATVAVPDRGEHDPVPLERLHLPPQRAVAGDGPVGGEHARVGDELAAAAIQLRTAAGDPLRAAVSFDLRHGRTATHAVAIDSGSAPPAPGPALRGRDDRR